MASMRECYAELDEIRMFYREGGAGQPVLLAHGGFANCDSWSQQFPALTQHHRVIAPDSRGHGRTGDGPGPISYPRLAEDWLALLDQLSIDRAIFIGWSDGGTASLHLAIHHPDRVRGLVLIGAPCNGCGRPKGDALRPLFREKNLKIWSHVVMDMEAADTLLRGDDSQET